MYSLESLKSTVLGLADSSFFYRDIFLTENVRIPFHLTLVFGWMIAKN